MNELEGRLQALLKGLRPNESGRLSFHDQCAAFLLLHRGFPQTLVAQTFGVTQSAMSVLAQCLTNPRRYKKVAAEFENLGRDAFRDKYTNQDILDRLARFRMERPETGDYRRGLLKGRPPNPNADSHRGQYQDHSGLILRILWLKVAYDNYPIGWYLWVKQYKHLTGRAYSDDDGYLPFLTSKAVYDSICHPGYAPPVKIIPPAELDRGLE